MRKLLLIVGAVVVPVVGALVVVNLALDETKVTAHEIAEPIREVVVRSGSGNVELVPGGEGVLVRETQHYVVVKPKLDVDVDQEVVTFDSHCNGIVLACYADLWVAVPSGVKVTVEADSGDVAARGLDGRSVHLKSDSGDVAVSLTGRQLLVWAHTDSGSVAVVAANARAVDAQSDSGDVDIAIRATPRKVVARTDSGDVDVAVPAGAYAVDAATDSGKVDLEGITRNDRAPRSIEAKTDSGDVTVKAR